MTLKSDTKFEENLICCLKNDKNLVNFDLSTGNSQNFHFHWFLLCKVYKVWLKKKSFLSWHCRVMQKFEEKMTCGLENGMKNLANFHQSIRKSQN